MTKASGQLFIISSLLIFFSTLKKGTILCDTSTATMGCIVLFSIA